MQSEIEIVFNQLVKDLFIEFDDQSTSETWSIESISE